MIMIVALQVLVERKMLLDHMSTKRISSLYHIKTGIWFAMIRIADDRIRKFFGKRLNAP